MGVRKFCFLSIVSLLLSPVMAQFGIGMRKKKASSFQDLNEQAKKGQDLGAMGDLSEDELAKMFEGVDMSQMQELWKNALNDPETLKTLEGMGEKFNEAMEELAKMSPEELQKQMQEAMSMLTDSGMADSIVAKKDEVLASLEQTGMVSPEELAKFKADPDYFEKKMRESFNQMKDIFTDPEMIKAGMQMMNAATGSSLNEMSKFFSESLDSDEKIEEARLEILGNPEVLSNPMMKDMFQTDEFAELIHDPKKWREAIKEGQKAFRDTAASLGQGAGVGEL